MPLIPIKSRYFRYTLLIDILHATGKMHGTCRMGETFLESKLSISVEALGTLAVFGGFCSCNGSSLVIQ